MEASIQNIAKGNRGNRPVIHIDFTPMVDLGFLLITFFMLTTTFMKQTAMTVSLPAKENEVVKPTKLKPSQAFTIILTDSNQVYYYSNADLKTLQQTDFSKRDLDVVLVQKSVSINPAMDSIRFYNAAFKQGHLNKQQLDNHINSIADTRNNIFVFIKSTNKSKYKNLVSIIDKLNLNYIRHYALDDLNGDEITVIDK